MNKKKEHTEISIDRLSPCEEFYLKITKEIVIKFIETGRVGVSAFSEVFRQVYHGIKQSISNKT